MLELTAAWSASGSPRDGGRVRPAHRLRQLGRVRPDTCVRKFRCYGNRFPYFHLRSGPRAKEGAQDGKETRAMKVTITTGTGMTEQAKAELLNMLWEQTQDKTGGGHLVEHDGGDALSQLANAEAERRGKPRWQ